MGDNPGYDPCEYVWSHESAMRRLISLLRNSQSYCGNEECFQDMPGPTNAQQPGSDGGYFQFMMVWVLLAMFLFLMRPASLFQRGGGKPSNNQGPRQPPPDNSVQ